MSKNEGNKMNSNLKRLFGTPFHKEKYDTQYDKMTKQPVGSLVVELGIPTTISMLVTSIYNMVDTIFVGRLGTSATGAVGVVFGFMAILQAVGFMIGQGSGSIISRRLGQKNEDAASRIASTAFFMALGIGIMLEIGCLIFIEPLMYIFGSTDTILPYAKTYVFYILLAAPFMVTCFVMNNILRYEGKAMLAMKGLMTGAVLNIIGDPILMFGFDMGIAGAGLATAASQIVSFLILLYMFLSGKTQSRLSVHRFTKDFVDIADILATGFPSLIRQGLGSISTMILNHKAGVYGDAAVAAMSVVSRISMMFFSVALGIGQGYQPVSGFNYGAGKYKRLKEAFDVTFAIGEVLIGLFATVGFIFANPIVGWFSKDASVIEMATGALQYQCVALFFVPLTVAANMTLQSTGQRLSAAFVSMLRSGLYFIPILLILAKTTGFFGIQIAQPAADILSYITCIPFVVMFFKKLPEDKE